MHNPAPVLENATHKLLLDFNIKTDHLIPARRPDLIIINKRKKQKESEKKDKYLDLARELKKLWNMKVTIVPIVIGALGTMTKGLLKGLEDLEIGGRTETIQMTALLRTARIMRKSWRFEETCCHSNSSEKPSVNTDVKNSKGVNNINNIGTVTKGLLKGLEDLEVAGRVETIQMTVLLRTARILRRVLET